MTVAQFQTRIRSWYRQNGRHNLPWRKTSDPYKILVSEVMLQQTQVSRVLRKYPEFVETFPDVHTLARAPLSGVLAAWQGMGYNRRAAYLKRLAGIIGRDYRGRVPADPVLLAKLPGIGSATAGAIAAFAFNRRTAFIETNIRRVYLHEFFPDRRRVADREILKKIQETLPRRNCREWYYALMDYGALALKGMANPNRRSAHYSRPPKFSGSPRELRGKILAAIIRGGGADPERLERQITGRRPHQRFRAALNGLLAEGLLTRSRGRIAAPR